VARPHRPMGAGAADIIVIVLREVGYGSNSALGPQQSEVRSFPHSGLAAAAPACRFRAKSGNDPDEQNL
jgi:hypothetical protein